MFKFNEMQKYHLKHTRTDTMSTQLSVCVVLTVVHYRAGLFDMLCCTICYILSLSKANVIHALKSTQLVSKIQRLSMTQTHTHTHTRFSHKFINTDRQIFFSFLHLLHPFMRICAISNAFKRHCFV